ncbi:hypothetical protein IL992_16610 [Microbispora sp. NEAU-D428]|uniref:hypothetical protein n=1 Tax=Microbispora sitophila TaxID=2771537 RepID=UPI00186837A8|nr:hypothetical protein [Microbispora sitophila]MBE3010806.1 hypothetical protein [Microbispora sitophila]
MTLRLRLIVPIFLAAGLMLSACGEPEPTAAEAGQVLKSHIDQTVKHAFGTDVEVTDPGGRDIPCGDGKFKRSYALKARERVGSGDPEGITLALVGTLDAIADYELVKAGMTPTYQQAVSDKYHTRIVLSSPSKGRMEVRGETDCLPLQ